MSNYMLGRAIAAGSGLVIGIILVILIFKFCNRDKKVKTEYDERQKVIRGTAYTYGFYTVLAYSGILWLADVACIPLPGGPGVFTFTGAIIGICVVGAYSIWHDAYWGINNKPLNYLIVFVLATVINIVDAAFAIINHTMIIDGQLQGEFINLVCAIMFIFIACVIVAKRLVGSRNEEE